MNPGTRVEFVRDVLMGNPGETWTVPAGTRGVILTRWPLLIKLDRPINGTDHVYAEVGNLSGHPDWPLPPVRT